MPKEAKKRGRRAEKKRKEEREAEETEQNANFVPIDGQATTDQETEYYGDGAGAPQDIEFHGLLTEDESEYFRNADSVLEANSFADPSERALFIANVHREAHGKELKIASSQGCSRLLEKLVLLSTPAQLKSLWRAFTGHFLGLMQHRFASHCCEMLFERSAVVAARETDPAYVEEEEEAEVEEGKEQEPFASMESHFEYMLNELEPNLTPLLTHTFASHPLRSLLLILSGQPPSSATSVVQSRKKERITVTSDFALPTARDLNTTLEVPKSFTDAAERIVCSIGKKLDVEELRAMAVHPIGGPTLQVLVQVELRRSRNERKRSGTEETLLGKLTGVGAGDDDDEEKEGKKGGFFSNLLYDSVGSHLAEKIMSVAPKKEFKRLYKAHFATRMGSLARNETAGFVVVRVLEKCSKEMLKEAMGEILKEVPGMIERGQVAVIKTLIDVCGKQDVDAAEIAKAIASAYDCTSEQLIFKMLALTPEELTPKPIEEGKEPPKPKRDPKQRHGSLLAQSMLQLPGEFHTMICTSLIAQSSATIVGLSQHPQGSHVIQAFLLSPHSTTPDKRKLLNLLRGEWATLAMHQSGSHIADAAWTATNGLMNYKQAIAGELLGKESELRESFFGRTVWRNWSMDKYKTRRNEWFNLAKEEASSLASGVHALKINGAGGAPAVVSSGAAASQGPQRQDERKKTAIELARERHAAKKRAASGQPKTGSNAVVTATKRQRVA